MLHVALFRYRIDSEIFIAEKFTYYINNVILGVLLGP